MPNTLRSPNGWTGESDRRCLRAAHARFSFPLRVVYLPVEELEAPFHSCKCFRNAVSNPDGEAQYVKRRIQWNLPHEQTPDCWPCWRKKCRHGRGVIYLSDQLVDSSVIGTTVYRRRLGTHCRGSGKCKPSKLRRCHEASAHICCVSIRSAYRPWWGLHAVLPPLVRNIRWRPSRNTDLSKGFCHGGKAHSALHP